jgi:hypothetical protein
MSELEGELKKATDDIEATPAVAPQKTRIRLGIKPVLLVGIAPVSFLVFDTLSSWIFGIPDETIQGDVITLLRYTDDKLQRDYTA